MSGSIASDSESNVDDILSDRNIGSNDKKSGSFPSDSKSNVDDIL